MFTIKKVIKVIEVQAKSLSFAAIFRMLRVCDENCAVVFAFLISAGSLLKSSAASFLKTFKVFVDVARITYYIKWI